MKGTVVGIDPGTTTAVCILDLNGGVQKIHSKKHLPLDVIINFIAEHGDPQIIATDVFSAPALVEKINASFNSVLHSPEKNTPNKQKAELISLFLEKNKTVILKNKHERAALVAAILAFNKYKHKLAQTERLAIASGAATSAVDEIKKSVIHGNRMRAAIKSLGK